MRRDGPVLAVRRPPGERPQGDRRPGRRLDRPRGSRPGPQPELFSDSYLQSLVLNGTTAAHETTASGAANGADAAGDAGCVDGAVRRPGPASRPPWRRCLRLRPPSSPGGAGCSATPSWVACRWPPGPGCCW
ncbi:hypothetical protein V2I01_41680 [Micromonospora sp. BRA006-A]|nr:hypothetical protein [Micromonospora sp. BRA006-A]